MNEFTGRLNIRLLDTITMIIGWLATCLHIIQSEQRKWVRCECNSLWNTDYSIRDSITNVNAYPVPNLNGYNARY